MNAFFFTNHLFAWLVAHGTGPTCGKMAENKTSNGRKPIMVTLVLLPRSLNAKSISICHAIDYIPGVLLL